MGSSARWSDGLPDALCGWACCESCGVDTEQASLLGKSALRDKLLALQILNAVLHFGNLGFVDFEGCLLGAQRTTLPLAGVGGFLPPVSHMMATMRNARPMRSQDWTFFGRRPWGFCVFS